MFVVIVGVFYVLINDIVVGVMILLWMIVVVGLVNFVMMIIMLIEMMVVVWWLLWLFCWFGVWFEIFELVVVMVIWFIFVLIDKGVGLSEVWCVCLKKWLFWCIVMLLLVMVLDDVDSVVEVLKVRGGVVLWKED